MGNTITLDERFIDKILFDQETGCWDWTGARSEKGYGLFSLNGKTVKAHRLAYEASHGPIEDGLFVLHHCDNPSCVNPTHLRLGTHEDNMRDRTARYFNDNGGQGSSSAKLTNREGLEIYDLAWRGPFTQARIAELYGVTQGTVSQIKRRRTRVFARQLARGVAA